MSSVLSKIVTLHCRFTSLFECLRLSRMLDWDVTAHIPMYLKAEILPEDPQSVRQRFWVSYNSASKAMSQWLGSLPEQQRGIYQLFTLPLLSRLFVEGLTRGKEVTERQQHNRKTETDAVVPRFAAIRAEAHFRFNRIARLRRAYRDALRAIESEPRFPVTFSYEEGGDRENGIPAQERLWFRVWDRRSFVMAYSDAYSPNSVRTARRGVGPFSEDLNHTFLEFVKAERLFGNAPPAGFWFANLFRLGVLGLNPCVGSPDEVKSKRAWLASWGYGSTPFLAEVSGLLTWPVTQGRFMASAQRRCSGVLVPVEAIYAAAIFGLMAVDLFTTTGARMNEVMQIRLTEDCIVRLKMPPPPESKDQSPRIRYILRLVPKGEKTNTPKDYFIGQETKHLLVRVAQMLGEHYQLEPGQILPSVCFDIGSGPGTPI